MGAWHWRRASKPAAVAPASCSVPATHAFCACPALLQVYSLRLCGDGGHPLPGAPGKSRAFLGGILKALALCMAALFSEAAAAVLVHRSAGQVQSSFLLPRPCAQLAAQHAHCIACSSCAGSIRLWDPQLLRQARCQTLRLVETPNAGLAAQLCAERPSGPTASSPPTLFF